MEAVKKQSKAKLSNGNTRESLIDRLPIQGPGRPKLTEKEKVIRRAEKDVVQKYIKEYEINLVEALPEIDPVLIGLAKTGNMQAITEIHKVIGAHKRTDSPIVPIQINVGEIRDKYKT